MTRRVVVPVTECLRCGARDQATRDALWAELLRGHGLDPDQPYRWEYDALLSAWVYEQSPAR